MRDLWYADNRDLIKWAVLIHIARSNFLQTVIQVPYWRPEKARQHFTFQGSRIPISEDVWHFFRNIQDIARLGQQCGVEVKVIMEPFKHTDRASYSEHIARCLEGCTRPLLLFFDPDTGLEPKSTSAKHTTKKEVRYSWSNLRAGDFLVLYQHARRENNWIKHIASQLGEACDGATIEVARSEDIGKDVALLCVQKRFGSS
ncbi:MAG: hypothetical protein PHT49_08740 [Desulfovibrionales bacterium]|nr:hypothetical protein [Desulfovibrionales bacterium]